MTTTLNIILFLSLGWLCHKMLLFYVCVLLKYIIDKNVYIKIYYFENGPNVNRNISNNKYTKLQKWS